MADLFRASLTNTTPDSMQEVNVNAGNVIGHSNGLFVRTDTADGWDISGVYVKAGFGVPAKPGRVYECTWTQDALYTQDSRFEAFAIDTQSTFDFDSTNNFCIIRNDNAGVQAAMRGAQSTDPDDTVLFQFGKNVIYTARAKIQADGSAKMYISGADTGGELFIGSSKIGTLLQTPYTLGTPIYMSMNCFKAFRTGPAGALTVNNFSVYDSVDDGESLLVLGNL